MLERTWPLIDVCSYLCSEVSHSKELVPKRTKFWNCKLLLSYPYHTNIPSNNEPMNPVAASIPSCRNMPQSWYPWSAPCTKLVYGNDYLCSTFSHMPAHVYSTNTQSIAKWLALDLNFLQYHSLVYG